MVVYSLKIKANFDNVTCLYPSWSDEFEWFIKVKCSTCGKEHLGGYRKISPSSVYLTKAGGRRDTANFVKKCKFCSTEGSVKIIQESIKRLSLQDSIEFTEIAQFDCRGLEPIEFAPMVGWTVEKVTGGMVLEIDLTEKEWVGYDRAARMPIGVYEFQSMFTRLPPDPTGH